MLGSVKRRGCVKTRHFGICTGRGSQKALRDRLSWESIFLSDSYRKCILRFSRLIEFSHSLRTNRLMHLQRTLLRHTGRNSDRVAAVQHNFPKPAVRCASARCLTCGTKLPFGTFLIVPKIRQKPANRIVCEIRQKRLSRLLC